MLDLEPNTREAFLNMVELAEYDYYIDTDLNLEYKTGMIVLVDNKADYQETGNLTWTKDDTDYKVKIEREKRRMIISTPAKEDDLWQQFLKLIGLEQRSLYAYDLNNWTCKYGKPAELLIAMHLSTQAPEFVYKFATSPVVDTKVNINLFPVTMNLKLVTEDRGEVTLLEVTNEAEKEILEKIKKDQTLEELKIAISERIKEYEGNWWTTERGARLTDFITNLENANDYLTAINLITEFKGNVQKSSWMRRLCYFQRL